MIKTKTQQKNLKPNLKKKLHYIKGDDEWIKNNEGQKVMEKYL
jgi:hypothetical protein